MFLCRLQHKVFNHRLRGSVLFSTTLSADLAPWINNILRYVSPRLLIPSNQFLPPLLCCLGVNPNQAAISRPRLNCLPSPTAQRMAVAMTGPMPGIPCKRLAVGSALAWAWIFLSTSATRLSNRIKSWRQSSNNTLKSKLSPFSASSSSSGKDRRRVATCRPTTNPYSDNNPLI